MFILYQTNNFKILKHMFLHVLIKKQFKNNIINILVANKNISLFLKFFFSSNLDIFANFKFYSPSKFIFKLCKKYINDISNINYFSKYNLLYSIMYILPKLLIKQEFDCLKKYLFDDIKNNKLFNLSYKISSLYSKYLIYRPDLLINWEKNILDKNINNIHQFWQLILWKKIVNFLKRKFNCKLYISKILFKFLNFLNKKNNIFKELYQDIFIFNINNLAPIYLNILNTLSKYFNIHYFIVNPCKEYWYDINYFNNINYYNYKNIKLIYDFSLDNNNLMFLYYNRMLVEYFYLLSNFNNIIEFNYFYKKFKSNKLLDNIRKNILYFKNFKINKKKLDKIDNSLIIKSCNGYFDEVNILKKFLLKIIINYKYKYSDILVLVTDMKLYYPYINLIFSDYKYKHLLPYIILDENLENNYVFLFLFKILNISNFNLNSYEFIKLLKHKIILSKFNINNNELEILLYFINNMSFIKDIKNFSFDNIILNKINNISLLSNIKSLLLSYAVHEKFFIWKNIFNYATIGNNYINKLIAKFSDFIFKILYWKKILNNKYNFNIWVKLLNNLIKDFFNFNIIKKYYFLQKNYYKYLLFKYKCFSLIKKIDYLIFIKILNLFINKKSSKKLFLLNHINICSIENIISLSFKVVCILGVNSNIYPKNLTNYNFDLMNIYYKIGDSSRFEYEKYLFFEKILLTRNFLYISYINISFKNFNKYFPSILLNNLLNYVGLYFNIYYKIKLKKLFYKCCNKKKNNNIDINNKFILINKNINIKYITLKNIYEFWLNPVKYFFNNSLYIKFNYIMNNLLVYYNIDFNIKNFYMFRKIFINYLLMGKNFNKNFYLYLQMLNLIPMGNIGKIIWNKEIYNIIKLFNRMFNYVKNIKLYNFNINYKNFVLSGNFKLYNKLNLHWIPKRINVNDLLIFWINHLIYNYIGMNCNSFLYGYNGIFKFKKLDINTSKYNLNFYINGFLSGIKNMLFFLPEFNNYYVFNFYSFNKEKFYKKKLLFKFKNVLLNYKYLKLYIKDIYINYLINNNYFIDYKNIIKQSEKWLLPMLKYLKIK